MLVLGLWDVNGDISPTSVLQNNPILYNDKVGIMS